MDCRPTGVLLVMIARATGLVCAICESSISISSSISLTDAGYSFIAQEASIWIEDWDSLRTQHALFSCVR